MSSTNLKLIIAMARTYNDLFLKIEKNVKEYGLTISEFGVLEMLLHKGEQPVQKVAEKILVTSGTITYVIDKLQKNNLVQRKKCDRDKRVFYLSLTRSGEELIREIFPKHKRFLDELLVNMDEGFKKDLIENLALLHNTIK
jgi:MarR family 2-MHQ and catechol resistance regulon transcriptional repressor